MVEYDPQVIYKFADRLYKQANSIIAIYTLIGGLTGGAIGYYFAIPLGIKSLTILCALFLAFLGFALGNERAFTLKLQAQTALCQVEIEANTRRNHVIRS